MNFLSILSFFCAAGVASAGTIFSVTDLGSLGGSAAQAFSINAGGQAVGSASNMFGYTHAFSSSGGGISDLTFDTGAADGVASAINASGEIAGTQFIGGQAYATAWTNGAPQSVGLAGSYAMGINDPGIVTGMLSDGHAFAGSSELTVFDWSSGYAINNGGQVAGYAQVSPGVFRGFIWTPSTGVVVLGTFGGMNSYAMAINNAGDVAGNAQLADGFAHAFVSSGGALQDLGSLGGSSYAYGINARGDVVGYSYTDGQAHAFLFSRGVMLDLNNLIDASSGWVLTQAYGINANGQIAGSGLLNGVQHAFRLDRVGGHVEISGAAAVDAPEPATWTIALGGLILIVSSRIRFQPRLRRPPKDQTRELPQ